jgi:glycosyltransferase involved in cell wall biosynthesis
VDDEGVQVVQQVQWARFSLMPRLHAYHWLRVANELFRRYVDRFGYPDIIHAHGALPAGRLAASIAQRTGIPYVLTEHSTAYSRGTIRPWQDALIRQVLRQAASRIVVSPDLGRRLEARYHAVACPWQWIPNVVSPIFRPAHQQRPATTNQRFRFLNVALLTAKKGHDVLLRAAAQMLPSNSDFELRIVGEGPCRRQLTNLAERLGVASRLTFLGTLDRRQVAAEMQSAQCFVLPSRHETFGVVLIEALACGLPVIASACGGPECIVEKSDGILVPPDDVAALARAMEQLRRTAADYPPELLQRRCLQRFGEQTVARQIAGVYARLLPCHHTNSGTRIA